MSNFGPLEWLVFSAVWLLGSFGTGAILALLYKRLYPSLAFYKLWAMWTAVVNAVAGVAMVLG